MKKLVFMPLVLLCLGSCLGGGVTVGEGIRFSFLKTPRLPEYLWMLPCVTSAATKVAQVLLSHNFILP
jgi:hypothetical protein